MAARGVNKVILVGHLHRAVLVYALAANGSQTGEGYIQGAGSAGPRTKSKPRPRQLNG